MKRSTAILFLTSFILQSYANPRPQQNSISNDFKTEGSTNVDVPSGVTTGSNDNQLNIKPGLLQRNPTFYQDIFNIPISTLQAVSNFLTAYSNSSLTIPPSTNAAPSTEVPVLSKDDQPISLLKSSPVSQLSEATPNTSSQNQANAGIPFVQIAQDIKQGLLIRLPTFYQDILRIPISTLQAVSNFLTTHYTTAANATVPKLPTNSVNGTTKNNQVQLETNSVSTSVDSSVNAPLVVNAADNDQLNTKQGFIHRNPTFYQDIFKIPISTLQAVSNLLSSGYTNISVAKTDSTNAANSMDQSSVKLLQSSETPERVFVQTPNQDSSKKSVEIPSQDSLEYIKQATSEYKGIEHKGLRAERKFSNRVTLMMPEDISEDATN